MRIPRTIGFRITLGFGLLIIAIIVNIILSYRIVARAQTTQENLSLVLEPSIRNLIELKSSIHQIKDLGQSWVNNSMDPGSQTLAELRFNLQERIPQIHQGLLHLSADWRERDLEAYQELYRYINDSLYSRISELTSSVQGSALSDTIMRDPGTRAFLAGFEHADGQLADLISRFDRLVIQASERSEAIYRQTLNVLLITGVLIVLSAIIIAVFLYLGLVRPINRYTKTITSMGRGVIPDMEFREGQDEMGQIGTALNSMIRGLGNLADFSEEIGKGNFRSDFTPLSEKDILGNSLIRLREDLQKAAVEEEKRKREDERRNWSNQGIARFSEILREHSGDRQALTDKLISELVNYLGARVGGIFLIQNTKAKNIELIAGYAYERKKHLKKTIEYGEGLIGRCVQEGNTILLTDVPEDYLKIKSGLGEDNPKSLIIVPIRLTDNIIGVIEIASFEIIQDFQIEFVERIGTTIASSLTG